MAVTCSLKQELSVCAAVGGYYLKMRLKIISGGQSGVDRAALDAAMAAGVPVGGWCPRGRLAEDGTIASKYPLVETSSADYAERTRLNVRDSDATLILCEGTISGGTLFTRECAESLNKPFLVVGFSAADCLQAQDWIIGRSIAVLNVAGPRASQAEAVYERAYSLMEGLIEGLGKV
ncbi:MAG TPA: putative molybdenum carrier protein [Candidatus Obscuribacterales bacterium]